MNRYPAYRETASPFLLSVPEEWKDVRLNALCKGKSIQNTSGEELLSVFLDRGVVSYRDTDMNQVHKPSEDMSKYQLVEPGDFVLNNQQAWRGSVGVSTYRGIVSPAYVILSIKKDINSAFMNYMVRETACVAQYVLASKGVGSIQRILNWNRLKSAVFVIPPREEQDQIVRYLDWQVSKTNKLIAALKKQIALLKARKQTVVNEAVTKGLHPDVPMKYSGVEWIGDIPAHWNIIKLRSILKPVSVKNHPELPLLSVVREQGVIVRDVEDSESNHNFIPDDLSNYKVVRTGQFAMNKMKAWQGSYGMSQFTGIVSPAYFIFDVSFENTEYFHYAIRSKVYVNFFAQASDGIRVGQWDLNMHKMKEIPFIVPPASEQAEIVSHIPKAFEEVEKAIEAIGREIELLKEYRTRLISDVVTGQVDVRGVEVPDFEYVADDTDDTSDDEEADADDSADEEV